MLYKDRPDLTDTTEFDEAMNDFIAQGNIRARDLGYPPITSNCVKGVIVPGEEPNFTRIKTT